MLNYETTMQYVGSPGHPDTILEPIKAATRDINYLEIAVMLETKWQKPIPTKQARLRLEAKR